MAKEHRIPVTVLALALYASIKPGNRTSKLLKIFGIIALNR
jgi:hypothetical protein